MGHFVLGCKNVTIAVDHQPLLKIFGDRSLDNISNTRLRNLKEKTLWCRFRMVHIPGVKNRSPDTLITGLCTNDQLHAIRMENQLQESLISSLHSTHTVNWEQVQDATSSDKNMLLPEFKHQLPPPIREFHQFRGHLYSSGSVVIYKDRIIIPPSLRPTCLSALHATHQGTSAMTAKAEASIFWPGITNDIQATKENCPHCNRMAPSQAALSPTPPTLPEYSLRFSTPEYNCAKEGDGLGTRLGSARHGSCVAPTAVKYVLYIVDRRMMEQLKFPRVQFCQSC